MAPIALLSFEVTGPASRETKVARNRCLHLKSSQALLLHTFPMHETIKAGKSLGGSAEIVVSSTNNPADLPKTTNNAVYLMVGGEYTYLRSFCSLITSMW